MNASRIVMCLAWLGLTLPLLTVAEVEAGKWKNVSQAETVIDFRGWPSVDDCRFVKRTTDDYSREITIAQCPRYLSKGNPSTFLRISELSPGYFWSGAKGEDFRESPLFKKTTG